MRRAAEALALLLLFGLGAYAHRDDVRSPALHRDEVVFSRAFAAVAHGESPYAEPIYYYPPPFAVLGARVAAELGEERFFGLLRLLNLAGACCAVWVAARTAGWPLIARWGVCAASVTWSFPVINAMGLGNVSPLIAALALAALALRRDHPWLAGGLLGTSVAFKPLALLAVALLAALGWAGDRRALRTSLAAVVSAGAWLAAFGGAFLPEMWRRADVAQGPEHDLSLGRIARGFGGRAPAWAVLVLVGVLAGLILLRAGPWRDREANAIIATAAVMSLPIVWSHTLLLALPASVLAIDRIRRLWRDRPAQRRTWALTALVAAAIFSLNAHSGSDAAPREWPDAALAAIALLPAATLIALTAFAVSEEAARDASSTESARTVPA